MESAGAGCVIASLLRQIPASVLEGFPQGFVHRSEWTVEELAERFHPRFTGPYASRS
jgi:hypothetical protein